MDKSEGAEAFIAEFERLVGKCVRAAEKGPRPPVRDDALCDTSFDGIGYALQVEMRDEVTHAAGGTLTS
jgi:hypothetical protein